MQSNTWIARSGAGSQGNQGTQPEYTIVTLSVAWIRRHGTVAELVVATDSRLRSALIWDCGPKIVPLPRTDALVCFAGETIFAYPMLLQLQNAVAMHYVSRSRRMDLYDFKGYTLQFLNALRSRIREDGIPGAEIGADTIFFLLAGYSWRRTHFALWTLHYDPHIEQFTYRPAARWRGKNKQKRVAWIGDDVDTAKERLAALLKERGKIDQGGFDMEPFEVLRDIIRSDVSPSIGGPPQVAKIYRHMNVIPFGVYWPNRQDGRPTVLGRELLHFERPEYGFIDPDTLEVTSLINAPAGSPVLPPDPAPNVVFDGDVTAAGDLTA